MKVTVVFNNVNALAVGKPEDILADEDTVKTAKAIAEAVNGELFELTEESAAKLHTLETDFFFNTAFGIGDAQKSEAEVVTLLEKTGKPFSGSNTKAIILTTNKMATKDILLAKNLPTPKFQIFTNHEEINPELTFPLFVKPNNEDCSLGISSASVVNTPEELHAQIDALRESYSEAVLVEEYIEGRELNVTVLGNGENAHVLPVSEIVFGLSFTNKYKFVDFAAKWEEETSNYKETTGVCPAILDDDIRQEVERVALEAFKATGCADYARVDIRLAKNHIPYILEVNANPGIGPEDGATRSAKAAGMTYPEFIQKIIDAALTRYGSA